MVGRGDARVGACGARKPGREVGKGTAGKGCTGTGPRSFTPTEAHSSEALMHCPDCDPAHLEPGEDSEGGSWSRGFAVTKL